ncbi:MAG: glutathione S-transferase N-terminal domain-containing protein, partial [Pseudomonadota bacterium]
MLTLYVAKNTIAVAAHIALQETGLPYQVKWISFAESGQRSPDFLSINPKGRVPALISGDDVITETPAILEFIAETAGLFIPSSISARARVRE